MLVLLWALSKHVALCHLPRCRLWLVCRANFSSSASILRVPIFTTMQWAGSCRRQAKAMRFPVASAQHARDLTAFILIHQRARCLAVMAVDVRGQAASTHIRKMRHCGPHRIDSRRLRPRTQIASALYQRSKRRLVYQHNITYTRYIDTIYNITACLPCARPAALELG